MIPGTLLRPAFVVGLGYGVILLALLATHGWDPRFFATVGPQWARHDPAGLRAGDGVAFYALADDPLRGAARWGAYRTERIFYPLLARIIAFGWRALVPWTLVLVNWAAIVLGTEILHRVLLGVGAPAWMALGYGAWGGLGMALLKDTAEPTTFLCALLGIWWLQHGRTAFACGAFLCALLGRETALFLIAPYLLQAGQGRRGIARWLPALAVLGVWQGWVLAVRLWLHGSPAPQVWLWPVPLIGFGATRLPDLPFSVIQLIIPAIVVLALGIRGLRRGPGDASLWAAVLNALLVLSLPPLTADVLWHSGRLSTGLVAATLLATSLSVSAPRTWRALAAVYASSACWTLVVAVRYLFWDIVVLGSLM